MRIRRPPADDRPDLDRYLDGELERAALPDDLRAEEELLARWMGALQEDVRAPRELREAVMRRIAAQPLTIRQRLVAWALRPRVVRITPAWSAATVAACALVLALWRAGAGTDPQATSGPGPVAGPGASGAVVPVAEGGVMTRFVLVAPNVGSVQVTGDFIGWDPSGVPLEDLRGTGVWTVDVALPPGIYQYAFIVDGTTWQPDPLAMSQVGDGFGQVNSVLIVSPRAEA